MAARYECVRTGSPFSPQESRTALLDKTDTEGMAEGADGVERRCPHRRPRGDPPAWPTWCGRCRSVLVRAVVVT
ncbi:hypothetical protein FRAAL1980 [Frankia alni ACN14a]|uniref:Uncharacterized protein n=1 Tax=Frankia alni (strain DSM 45986 / CECT 9034 / ACN14a) TaxID=326424 RepID=Q0RPA3_FRAAA|nr:hypothetical protein FRAAL1980 [Frankia alni ACN14a]